MSLVAGCALDGAVNLRAVLGACERTSIRPRTPRYNRQALPDCSRRLIQGIIRGLKHQVIRREQMLEALRHTPPRDIGPPIQLPRAEAAKGGMSLSTNVVEPGPHVGQ